MESVPYWAFLAAIWVEFSVVFLFDENLEAVAAARGHAGGSGGAGGSGVAGGVVGGSGGSGRAWAPARAPWWRLDVQRSAYRTVVRFAAYVCFFAPMFAAEGVAMAAATTLFIGVGRGLAWRVAKYRQRARGYVSIFAAAVLILGVFGGAWAAWRFVDPAPLPWVRQAWEWVTGELAGLLPGLRAHELSPRTVIVFLAMYSFMFDGATFLVRSVLGSLDLVVTTLGPPWPPVLGTGTGTFLASRAETAAGGEGNDGSGGGGASKPGAAADMTVQAIQAAQTLNTGKVIGSLERLLILTLMVYGQYQVIGLVVTAKSIFRFEATSRGQAEYYLVGTLTSVFVAVTAGFLLQNAVLPG